MAVSPEPPTRASVLERLRNQPTDQEAWREFVDLYGPMVYSWCRHWQLQAADAEDVTQTVLTILAVRMKSFAYDPSLSFRGWLQTVTRHAWTAFVADRQRAPRGGDPRFGQLLESAEAGDDLVRRLQEQFDHERLELASARVRARVRGHTWEAFRLTALEGRPAAEVAEQLGMNVATVYVARSKVQKLLRQELAGQDGPAPPGT